MIELSLTIEYDVACVSPNATAVVPVKPVPVMVTEVPPAVVPDAGEIPVTVGIGVAVGVGVGVAATVIESVYALLVPAALLAVNETV